VSVRQALMVSLLFMPNNGCAAAKVSDNGTLGGKSLAINMMWMAYQTRIMGSRCTKHVFSCTYVLVLRR